MERKFTTNLKRGSPATMKNILAYSKKRCFSPLVWLSSSTAPLRTESKKGVFGLNHWRFSKKAKCLTVVAIVAVLLISAFAFLPKQGLSTANAGPQPTATQTATPTATSGKLPTPTPFSQGAGTNNVNNYPPTGPIYKAAPLIELGQPINNATWTAVATDAWNYFQPGEGVDSNTGLPYAGSTGFEYFTDWDLGCYIQAAIDAQQLGLISNNGNWSFSARMNYVIAFLENRTLDAQGYPYQFYDATTGNYSALSGSETVDIIDTGRLFVALNNLGNYNSSLAPTINNIVLKGISIMLLYCQPSKVWHLKTAFTLIMLLAVLKASGQLTSQRSLVQY